MCTCQFSSKNGKGWTKNVPFINKYFDPAQKLNMTVKVSELFQARQTLNFKLAQWPTRFQETCFPRGKNKNKLRGSC